MTLRLAVVASCVACWGCAGGSETGNPVAPTEIGLGVRSSDPAAVAVSSGAKGTVIEEAWVAFGQMAFLPEGQCGLLEDYPHMGPTLIAADLAAPDIRIAVDVKPDSYCGMVVPLETETQDLNGDAPPALRDHGIVLRGRRSDGIAFTLAFPEQDELELQALAPGTFEVQPGEALFLAFDVATWMNGVDLERAQIGADGAILVDETHNLPQLLTFESNIDCSLELFEDSNGSGALESGDKRIARCAPN